MVYQIDVKSTFLNGVFEKELYMEKPPSYEVVGDEKKVYRLKRALYVIKKAPWVWYNMIDSYLMSNGRFSESDDDPTLHRGKK